MNGCFCFPIGCYLIRQLRGVNYDETVTKLKYPHRHRKQGYESISSDSTGTKDSSSKQYLKRVLRITLELLGFLMQLGALASIPVLLSLEHFYVPSGKANYSITATYILIPVSLCIISIVWSGWIQKLIMRPSGNRKTAKELLEKRGKVAAGLENTSELSSDDDKTARFKAGTYVNSYIAMLV